MAVKKISKLNAKEMKTESGIIIKPSHEDERKIIGNEAFIEKMEEAKKEEEDEYIADVREHDKNTYIVYDKITGKEIRVYVKEPGCENPEACAREYIKRFKKYKY
jgi:hypothetical protein